MPDLLQLKITLSGTKPPIWRRVLVSSAITFIDLHHVIQIAMGWKNAHLFEFYIGDITIRIPDEDFGDIEEFNDARDTTLELLLANETKQFEYEYDFGDSWRHTIEVEKIFRGGKATKAPVCIDGEMNCPPEDCGGIPGFYNLLKALADKNHPEHRETKAWLGTKYNPNKFDKETINKELPKYKSYLKQWQ